MDEENQNQTEQPDAVEKFVKRTAQEGQRKIKNHAKNALRQKIMSLGIMVVVKVIALSLVVAIVATTLFTIIAAIEDWIDGDNAETIDEVTYQTIKEYCTIDETGIHFDKEGFLKNITVELAKNGIDLDSLGLGEDKTSLSDSNTILGNNIAQDSEAAQYLYKFVTASLAGEFPYIEGSDPETQGIIKIKRKIYQNDEEKTIDLTYMGYEEFTEKLKTTDDTIKDDLINYFSLDESWNLCIAKPYKRTENHFSHGSLTSSSSEYTISEVKIPYRTMVSQYTVPFLFLIDLQIVTQNATYVEAVAELMTKQSEIEFTIFDEITEDKYEYTYKATRYTKRLEYPTDSNGNPILTVAKVSKLDVSQVEEKTTIFTQTDKIKANVTKAKTWIIEQETNYEMQTKKEYPYSESGKEKTTVGSNSYETEEEGTWDNPIHERWYEEIIINEWVKSGDTNTKIMPSKFMGLWSNATGTYVKGAPYLPVGKGKLGKVVEYNVRGTSQTDRPIINIVTAREELYDYLASTSKTQLHSELMQELIGIYMRGEELPEGFGVEFEELFDPDEFLESDWNRLGSGFWWPIGGTPSYEVITSKFGYRGDIGLAGASKYHKGIDIGIPNGTDIIASADGIVEVSDYSNSAGFYIKINHGNGIKTIYMHNSKLLVAVGQEVKQGDVIALSGNSGNSTGPHLHFGIEVNGEYVDPLDYVSQENRRPIATIPDVPASVEAWRKYIEQAFAELGYDMTQEKVEAILRQITTESSGDQFAIQGGYEDANTGTEIEIGDGTCPWCPSPSGKNCGNTNIGHGLLQIIPTTFEGYKVPGHDNIFNGYDQICACINEMERRLREEGGSYSDYIGNGIGW